MGAQRFYERYLAVEAIQYTGENADEVIAWGQGRIRRDADSPGVLLVESRQADYKEVYIYTHKASPGDWVVLQDGEHGVVPDERFAEAYEPAGPEARP